MTTFEPSPTGYLAFVLQRRDELAAGDPPAIGMWPAYLPHSDRKLTFYNRIPIPEGGGGRKPFAGQDDDE